MISSRSDLSKILGVTGGALAGLVIAFTSVAQEKPRSLVPSFVETQSGEASDKLQEKKVPVAGETPKALSRDNSDIAPGQGGTGDSLIVESLAALNPGSVGLLGVSDGGFGPQMWLGTSSALAVDLLAKLPSAIQSPQMINLRRRLLLTGAILDNSGPDADRILDVRLQKLREAGKTEDVSAILGRLPAGALTTNRQKIAAEMNLLQGRDDAVCRASEQQITEHNADTFWTKVAAYCSLLEDQFDRAELSAALLEEQGEKDPLFTALFGRLAGDEVPVSAEGFLLRPIHVAMMRHTEIAFPSSSALLATPEIINGLVMSPKLSGAAKMPVAFEAAKAETADIDVLQQTMMAFSEVEEKPLDSQMLLTYAALFAAANSEKEMAEKVTGLAEFWQLAIENGHFGVISKLTLNNLLKIPPADYGAAFNFGAVRVLLLNKMQTEASVWERVIRRAASQGTSEERLAARAAVMRLDAYMLLSGGNAIARWNSASFSAWENATDRDPKQGEKTEFLLSMLDVFGYPVTLADWQAVLFMDVPLETAASRHALERNLIASASAGRVGETVALSLLALGDAGPGGVTTTTLIAVTSALKAIGLEAEARGLAIEAAIAMDF